MRTMRQSTEERQAQILDFIRSGIRQVEDISGASGVSPSTVRRDLAVLQELGLVTRTYGGAAPGGMFTERSVDENTNLQYAQKMQIASRAAEFIAPNSTIFIDAGTTCKYLAENLVQARDLTVVTRGLEVASVLASSRTVTLVMLGGTVRPLSHGLVGPLAELAVSKLHFDVAFFGVDALDSTLGIGEATLEEISVKESVATRSSEIFVLADATKLDHSTPPAWSTFNKQWTLVTDDSANPALTAGFSRLGVQVDLVQMG